MNDHGAATQGMVPVSQVGYDSRMDRQWVVDLVERLPQGVLSRGWGWIARRRHPRLGVEILKRVFVKAAGIDMTEAEQGTRDYSCLEELFLRRLRPGARRIDPDPTAFVCPVDGRVGQSGRVTNGTLLQVKGRSYELSALLGDAKAAARFEGGTYVTLYLSPRDYHRVHSPVSGQVAEAVVIPGALMPVFGEAVSTVDELFARNERLITYVDSPDAGRVAMVKVGAMMVGKITLAFDPTIHTNRAGQGKRQVRYDPPRMVQKGAELGAFEMGSTVVAVTEPGCVDLVKMETGTAVRMGQRLGVVVGRKRKRRPTSKKKSGPATTSKR